MHLKKRAKKAQKKSAKKSKKVVDKRIAKVLYYCYAMQKEATLK